MNSSTEQSRSVPSLRFPEFKGEWEKKKLGEVATNKSGKYNPEKETNSVKCIELEHLAQESAQLLGYIDGKNSGSIKNKFVKGDVLFGKLRPYLKKYLLAPFDGVCSSEIWVLKGKDVSSTFLYRIIQTDKFIDLANQSSGSKMPRADWNVVENGIFSFPTLPEQSKIASFLTAVDKKLQALKQKKSLLEQYKKGVMQKLFSQELRFKDENGKEFPKWEKLRLGNEATFFSGGTPLTTKKIFYDGEIPFIKSGEINDDKTEQFITQEGLKNSSAKMVEVGDLLYALYGATSGEAGISKINGAINQAVLCIRSKRFNIIYLLNFLQLTKSSIVGTYLQGGQGNLSADIIKNLIIPTPNENEQNKIADFLKAIDSKIISATTQIQQTQQYKKGLLQKMFV